MLFPVVGTNARHSSHGSGTRSKLSLVRAIVAATPFLGLVAIPFSASAATVYQQTVITSFDGANGLWPESATLMSKSGALFGTTSAGGTLGYGTIYQLASGGALKTIYSFNGASDGSGPGQLAQGSNGYLYGMTSSGGSANRGTIFTVSPKGVVKVIHTFSKPSDGAYPYSRSPLVEASDGNFYGTTSAGGGIGCAATYGCGTVFKMTPSGKVTILHAFTGETDGQTPYAGLAIGDDGNFYGTTNGASGVGTIYQITPGGTLSTLSAISYFPNNTLVKGADGNFYSTTNGGVINDGEIYSVTPQGVVTTLYSFQNSTDGKTPDGGLTLGTDQAFYGVTQSGGSIGSSSGCGTVFRYSPTTGLSTLFTFNCSSTGAYPSAGIMEARPGTFYGTTQGGGSNDDGLLFKLTAASN